MIDVSVIIVSWNVRDKLIRCLRSIFRFTRGVKFEVVVVDNSSADDTVEAVTDLFPQAKLIKNITNRWYSGGNNQGAARAKGKYLFFVNPDAYLKSDAITDLVGWMDRDPLAAAAEPLQLSDTGAILPTGSKLNSPWLDLVELTFLSRLLGNVWRRGKILTLGSIRRFRYSETDRRKNWKTEIVSGAAMMVRKDIFHSVGGFAEELKLYYTDTDLCRRIILAGKEVWHLGKIQIVHSLSASTGKLSPKYKNQIFAGDARKYYRLAGKTFAGELLYLSMLINGRLFLK